MPLKEICALPVQEIADKDCLLFLWATMPKLPEALKVINAWGFRYTTCAFVWVKVNKKGKVYQNKRNIIIENGIYSGLGSWTNGNAELCLLAKRGRPKRNLKNVKQITLAPVGRHSTKPLIVRPKIVDLCGDLPRVELFARDKVSDWQCWGNEVESDIKL